MTTPALHADRSAEPYEPDRGRRFAIAALLLLPAVIVEFVALEFLGTALQHALGLEEGQLLTEAGVRGTAAAVLVISLSAIVPVIGTLLALRARRLGEGRLATVALVVWGFVGIGFVVLPALGFAFDALADTSGIDIAALVLGIGSTV